jgi:transposase
MFHDHDMVERLRRNETQRHIQKALGVSPKTVSTVRAVATVHGWLTSEAALPAPEVVHEAVEAYKKRRREEHSEGRPAQQVSVVEPHRALVEKWVAAGVDAQTIFSALARGHKFTGSYSSVRRFVRRLKATTPDPIVRLQFSAGEMAQVDFGSGPRLLDPATGRERKTWVFVMTLAYSRHQYAELVWDQEVATWLRCHRNAFEFWGGVPAKVRVDNLKAAITRACRYDPLVQRAYGEFAKASGFIIDPCVVATPEHKGRVEAGVKYVKKSFLKSPRVLRTLPDANQQLLGWVLEEAGNRIHGTTHQMPLRVFADEEKAALKPLPSERVETAVWATVTIHPDCHVVFEKAYYSVPYQYIGRKLDLRATDSTVTLFEDTKLVASWLRAKPGGWRTDYSHYPPEKVAYLQQTPQWCLEQAQKVGEACYEFMCVLLGDRIVDRLRAAQGLLRLRKKYGSKRLEAACQRALAFDNIQYRTVKRILDKGLDALPLREGESGQLDLPFIESPRFARDIADMFAVN